MSFNIQEASIVQAGKFDTEKDRIIQLDGLRFFAVTMVMIAHWLQWQWSNPVLSVIPFVHGVTLFFVLSGFLITRILLDAAEQIQAKETTRLLVLKWFYIRRSMRIFPIYYLLILGLFIFNYQNTRQIFPWLVTYTSNIYQYLKLTPIGDFNHFWSLAVEEQFYLFWPLLLLWVAPQNRVRVIIGAIILSILAKLSIYTLINNWMVAAYSTISCMCVLGIGGLMAYATKYQSAIVLKLSNPILLYGSMGVYSILFASLHQFEWYKMVLDELLFGMVAALVVLRASTNGFKGLAKKILEHPHIKNAGKVSYGLYVFHLFMPSLFYYLAPKLGIAITNKYVFFIALYWLTYFFAIVSWKLLESPIQVWRDKRFQLKPL